MKITWNDICKLEQQLVELRKHFLDSLQAAKVKSYWDNPIPWSSNYEAARKDYMIGILSTTTILNAFKRQESMLSEKFGFALDERIIEWPWALQCIEASDKRLLDAGSALNHDVLLGKIMTLHNSSHTLDIMTLAPEETCEWQRGISYLFGDLRDMPYKDKLFDLVLSISTLEHIGMDNTQYKKETNEHQAEDVFKALQEFKRILKPEGRLAFTVPFGKYEDLGTFQQFDMELLERCATVFNPSKRCDLFFAYSAKGWQKVTAEQCVELSYAVHVPDKIYDDRAAAARGLACCQWWV